MFSFVIGEDGNFVETEQSFLSDLINVALDTAVSDLSMEERINVYNMIEKFGLYSLISGQNDNPYADNEEKMKDLLDIMDSWGLLSEAKKEELAKKSLLIANICEAITIYEKSSVQEKQALHKLLGLLAASACAKMAGGVVGKFEAEIDGVKKHMNDIYDEISALLSQFRDDIMEQLSEIKDGIFEKIDDIADTITDYLKECYDNVKDIVDSILGKGNHMFSININVIKAELVRMRGISKSMTVQIQRLSDVKYELNKEKYGAHMAALVTIIANLKKQRKSYDEMADTLDKIVDLYITTEKKLCA